MIRALIGPPDGLARGRRDLGGGGGGAARALVPLRNEAHGGLELVARALAPSRLRRFRRFRGRRRPGKAVLAVEPDLDEGTAHFLGVFPGGTSRWARGDARRDGRRCGAFAHESGVLRGVLDVLREGEGVVGYRRGEPGVEVWPTQG